MKQTVIIHERIKRNHPSICEEDMLWAWNSRQLCQVRLEKSLKRYVAFGFDGKGRPLQMVATYDLKADTVLIFHAMVLTSKVMRELGLI